MYSGVYNIPNTEVIKQAVYAVCRIFRGRSKKYNQKYRVFNKESYTVIWTGNHVLKFFCFNLAKKSISLHCFLGFPILESCNVENRENLLESQSGLVSLRACVRSAFVAT